MILTDIRLNLGKNAIQHHASTSISHKTNNVRNILLGILNNENQCFS